ncbi:MAG TPA: RNase adapter RapZ [Thermaerobacter sp.]
MENRSARDAAGNPPPVLPGASPERPTAAGTAAGGRNGAGDRPDLELVVVTGLSGAGKTQAIHALEDLGFFCVDNLPPALLAPFADLCRQSESPVRRVAVVIDVRGGDWFDQAVEALQDLDRAGVHYRILFLEASDETLVKRFKETRRRHPLAPQGRLLEGIRAERQRLGALRGRAHVIVDTSELSPRQLRQRIADLLGGPGTPQLIAHLVSFGFRYGLPADADLVFDVRFLPNPHYVPELQPLTGLDDRVREYVLRWPTARRLLQELEELLDFLLPQYVNEGKTQLTVAIGCTGGQHRSVVITEALAAHLRGQGYPVLVEHRDVERSQEERVRR